MVETNKKTKGKQEMKMNIYKYNYGDNTYGWAVDRVGTNGVKYKTTIYVNFEAAMEMAGVFCRKHNIDINNVNIATA